MSYYVDKPPPPPEAPEELAFVLAGSLGSSPYQPRDEAYFLRLMENALPTYVEGLKRQADNGYEILIALARVGARCSLALSRFVSGSYIAWAEFGAKATGTVVLSRRNAQRGALIVKSGSLVTTRSKRVFRLLADVPFGALDLGPHSVAVEAVYTGWDHNVEGESTTKAGEVLPGEINAWAALNEDPPYADPNIDVRQIVATTGGRAAMLEQHGLDREVIAQPGEAAESYRARLRQVPDTVSPRALMRAAWFFLQRVFGPGVHFWYIEPWEITYQGVWDGPISPIGAYDPTVFTYNDPRISVQMRNRWLSEDDTAGSAIVVVPDLQCVEDFSLCFDDPGVVEDDFNTGGHPGWYRSFNCYDMPDTFVGYLGCPDGWDAGRRYIYKGIFDLLQRVRAGGNTVTLELEGK